MIMKRKYPLCVDQIRFYTHETIGENETFLIEQFPYDDRHDFIVDETFDGVAVQIILSNNNYDKGVRREISLSVVDVTTRCELACRKIRVNMNRKAVCKSFHSYFPAKDVDLKPAHTYKVIVRDCKTSQPLAVSIFHLFDARILGHPTKWYEVCDGGVRPAWEQNLYKSLNTVDDHDYYVRFNIAHKFGTIFPDILPELELRLYYPDGSIAAYFKEPTFHDFNDLENNLLYVEFPFLTTPDINGVFYAELLCMEYPIAGLVFDTTVEDKRGSWFGAEIAPLDEYTPELARTRLDNLLCGGAGTTKLPAEDEFDKLLDKFIESQNEESDNDGHETPDAPAGKEDENDEPIMSQSDNHLPKIDDLTGLGSVKEKLRVYERVVRFNKMRSEKGLPVSATPLHAMFLGSPGTGKTTVAGLMGDMLRQAGILSKGHVVVRERTTLIGQFYNSEAEKTLAAIEAAQGGILLIDEAYQLYQPNDPKDPGKFVIETLLTALSDTSNRDWMLILAGYPDEMKRMFEMNPGFKSRIPDSNIYIFDDFTEDELMEIAVNYLSGLKYTLTDEAHRALHHRLKWDYFRREKTFGNARHVINMIQTEILPAMAVRVTDQQSPDGNSLSEIHAEDIPCCVELPSNAVRHRVGFIA